MIANRPTNFPWLSSGIAAGFVLAAICSEVFFGTYTWLTELIGLDGQPYFRDLGVLLDGLAVFREGRSPYDIAGSSFNYPPAWKIFAAVPFLKPANVVFLGLSLIVAFYAVSVWFLQRFGCPQWVATPFLISPPVLLLLERGNCDIIVYLILALSAVFIRSQNGQIAAVFAATMLKLFPIGAITIWWYQLRDHFTANRWKILVVILLFAIGLLVQLEGLRVVSDRTPRPFHYMSFGLGALPALVAHRANLSDWSSLVVLLSFYTGIAVVGVTLWLWLKRKPFHWPDSTQQSKNLFLVGAGCFLVSNIIGFNWEYRLVFLLLAIPEIVALRSKHPTLSRVILASMLVLFYQTLIKHLLDKIMHFVPYRTNHFYVVADIVNLVVFYLIAFLMAKLLFSQNDPALKLELRRSSCAS